MDVLPGPVQDAWGKIDTEPLVEVLEDPPGIPKEVLVPEEMVSIAERLSEDEHDADAGDGAEVPSAAELTEPFAFVTELCQLQPDRTFDGKDDVVAEAVVAAALAAGGGPTES